MKKPKIKEILIRNYKSVSIGDCKKMIIKQTENQVKKQITDYLTIKGWSVYRINNTGIYDSKRKAYFFHGKKGVSDIIAIRPNYPVIFCETKATGKKPDKNQTNFINLINKTSCDIAIVADSLESLISQLEAKDII